MGLMTDPTIAEAFALGYMMGATFHFEHCKDKNGIDFHEALRRFDRTYGGTLCREVRTEKYVLLPR